MNITAERSAILTDVQALSKKVEGFRAGLLRLIQDLPDNPAITRLSGKSYLINSKDLTQTFIGKTRDGKEKRVVNNSWSPEMHDFRYQYKRIAVIINKVKFEDICNTLDRIIDEGGYTTRSKEWGLSFTWPEKFHPGVIENIRKIWRPTSESNGTA